MVINNVKVDPKLRIHTFCHAVPNKWYLQGAILSAGIVLDWFIKNMGLEDLLIKQDISPHSKLIEEAEKAPAGSAGLIFLPYLFGERSPHMDPYARGVLLGLNFLQIRGYLIKAVMEGVAFALRVSCEVFRELGVIANEILIRGGGKSTLWRPMISDVFGCRILATEVKEATFGAAILAAVGVGAYSNVEEALKSIVKLYPSEEPSSDSMIYEKLYNSIYKKLYPAIKEFFKILCDF